MRIVRQVSGDVRTAIDLVAGAVAHKLHHLTKAKRMTTLSRTMVSELDKSDFIVEPSDVAASVATSEVRGGHDVAFLEVRCPKSA